MAVGPSSVEIVESQREPAEVAAADGRRDVDAVGCLLCTLDDACNGADDDVGRVPALQGRQDHERVERTVRRGRFESSLHAALG